jgi:hypothetical protein
LYRKTVGNQNHDGRLDFHVLKTPSTTVEMFEITEIIYFRDNIEEKCQEGRKNNQRLKNQIMNRKFYIGKWIFKA